MKRRVELGRTYRCPVCGAEIAVISASSQELDPHCCNVPMKPLRKIFPVYYCEICGSEIMAIQGKDWKKLEASCCNKPMTPRVGGKISVD